MRQSTAFKEYFLQLLRLLRQGTVSFVLFESLCSLYLVHCVPWSLCFFGRQCAAKKCCFVSCSSELFSLISCDAVLGRYNGFHLCGVYSIHCILFFHLSVFFSSSVFWCNVSVHCVFTGVVCFVNVFTFDLLPLTCSVVSYCLLEMMYSIQYSVYILFNWPFCLRSIWCVYVIVCARW